MALDVLMVCASLLLLFAGAEGLIRGSASLAVRAGVSPLVVGLTVVAFGTSSPELVVSLKAALAGHGDISVGNIVGSNVFNTGVILGLAALLCPIAVHQQIIRVDAPLALVAAVGLPILLADRRLDRPEAGLLVLGIAAYTVLNLLLARRSPPGADQGYIQVVPPRRAHWWTDLALVLGGLAVLVAGSRLLVGHAVSMAEYLGVSKAVIGLTIVAAGTSMPELATSLLAAARRQPDIAIGNAVGSNIFNLLGIAGVSGLCAPLSVPGITTTDYVVQIAFAALLLPLLYTGRRLHRLEGALLLALYGGYLWLLWPQH